MDGPYPVREIETPGRLSLWMTARCGALFAELLGPGQKSSEKVPAISWGVMVGGLDDWIIRVPPRC
jgi:hypothetical protein